MDYDLGKVDVYFINVIYIFYIVNDVYYLYNLYILI